MGNLKYIGASLVIALGLGFGACSGGGGGTSNGESTLPVISGIAVDGYISGGTACLDKNINGRCDSGEPTAPTDANGRFTFTDVEVDSGLLMPVIVTGGTDTATNKPFEGSMSNIINTDDIATNASFIVSPLTDLVATSFLASNEKSATSLTQIKTNVASSLNISLEKVDDDPMQDKEVFAKAQEIQQTKELIQTAATKAAGSSLSEEELAKSVREAMAASVQSGTALNTTDVITKLEETHTSINIPSNERDFIVAQTTEIKKALTSIVTDTTTTLDSLNELQKSVETTVESASANIEAATEGSVITVVKVSPCSQVISYATNPSTQKCEQFATPCDVPSGWVSCEPTSTPITTTIPTPPAVPAL